MFIATSQLESEILRLLAVNYPLTAKTILEKIEYNKSKKYSLAGVHRALTLLLHKGMIHKNKQYYQLQTDQLIQEKAQIQSVLDRYSEATTYHNFQKQETFYYFATLSELDLFWNAVIEKWFHFYPKKRYAYWQKQAFPWFAILQLNEERRVIKYICELTEEFKTVCADNPMTRQLQPIYKEYKNSHFYLAPHLPDVGHAFAIFGDHVIETRHPAEVRVVLEDLCKPDSKAVLMESILHLAQPGSYKLEISKDREKADRYRKMMEVWMS